MLKHRVMVGGHAHLRGGPILLDDEVLIEGNSAICGDVIIEHQVAIRDGARVEASAGDAIHIRGAKVISGDEHITRTPIVGFL